MARASQAVSRRDELARMNRFRAIPALPQDPPDRDYRSAVWPLSIRKGTEAMDASLIAVKEADSTPARSRTFAAVRTSAARLLRLSVTLVALAFSAAEHLKAADVSPPPHSPQGNAVTHWNAVALDAFAPSEGTNPMAQ